MKRTVFVFTSALVAGTMLATVQLSIPQVQAQFEQKAPAGSVAGEVAKEVVNTLYTNLAAGKIKDNENLLRTTEISFSGIDRGNGNSKARAWSKTPAQYFNMHGDKPKYLKVDSVQVDLANPALAVARVHYHQGGQKGHAVVTLALEEKTWRITSLYEETHFVW